MANAKVSNITVVTETEGVTLELTKDEAQTIADITCFTGGDPKYSRRGLVDEIGRALRQAGINGRTSFDGCTDVRTALFFSDSK